MRTISNRDRALADARPPDRADSLAADPFAIGIEVLPHKLSVVLADHYGMIRGHRNWQLPDMKVSTVVEYAAKAARYLVATHLGLELPNRRIVIGLNLSGAVERDRDLARAFPRDRANGRGQPEARWVAPSAASLLTTAARLLPAAHRGRYAEEYRSELWDLAQAGAGRMRQLRYAFCQLRSALPMSVTLRSPRRRSSAP